MVRETRHLFIGNLPSNLNEDRIIDHFKKYGKVQSVKILGRESPGSDASATIAFIDIKSASKAHNSENKIDERLLKTNYYEPPASSHGSPAIYIHESRDLVCGPTDAGKIGSTGSSTASSGPAAPSSSLTGSSSSSANTNNSSGSSSGAIITSGSSGSVNRSSALARHSLQHSRFSMHCECKNAPSPDCASCSKPLFHQTGVQYDGRLYHNDCFRCSICLRRFGRNQKPIECRIANRLVCESCRSKDLRNAHKVAGQQRTCVLCQSALTNSPSHIKRDSSSPPARSEPSSSPNNHYHCNSCRQHRVVRKPLPTNSTSHHEFGHRVTGGRSPLVATALANPVSPNIAQLMHKLERTAIGSSRRTRSADPHPHHYYHHTCHKHSDHQQPKVCNNCAECTCNRARRRAHSCHTSPIARRAIVYDRYAAKPTSPRSSNRSVRSFGCDCKCWRCQRPVYENEKVWSLQRAWHRSCLRCVLCDAALSPGMHSVSPDGRPICNFPCSNRLYGSARYGYGCRERHT